MAGRPSTQSSLVCLLLLLRNQLRHRLAAEPLRSRKRREGALDVRRATVALDVRLDVRRDANDTPRRAGQTSRQSIAAQHTSGCITSIAPSFSMAPCNTRRRRQQSLSMRGQVDCGHAAACLLGSSLSAVLLIQPEAHACRACTCCPMQAAGQHDAQPPFNHTFKTACKTYTVPLTGNLPYHLWSGS